MDRPPHDYAAMAFAQQQQQAPTMPGQQYGFPPQHQQYPPQHAPPFLPPHPSGQHYPFQHQQPPQQMHPHPPHPHLIHPQQQQQPPPAFPPHMPPHMGPSFPGGPYDAAPPPVPPPQDPELRKRIDKLVEYVAKNGPGFEAMVCEKEQKNPDYSFLFGGEGHGYYRYKLFLLTRSPAPFGAPFPPPMPGMHPPPMNPTAASGPMMGPPQMHQPPFPHYDQQQPYPQPYMGEGRQNYDQLPQSFRGLSGPLPSDIAMELNNVIVNLTGTKESIKSAKAWFMQRAPFAPALAEALRDRVFALEDSEKQLHIVYLANDILFDR